MLHCSGYTAEVELLREEVQPGASSGREMVGGDERLDQELCCFPREEGPDPADIVESKSAGLGHCSPALQSVGQLIVKDHAVVPLGWGTSMPSTVTCSLSPA